MLPLCLDEGIGVIPWSPLARGRLTRDWDATTARSQSDRFGSSLYSDEDRRIVDAVAKIAESRGVTRAQVALAWVLRQPAVTAPIVGATKPRPPRGRDRRGRPRAVRRRGRATRRARTPPRRPRVSELTDKVGRVAETRIVLVRHGESLAQERRVVGGHGCTGLSDLGVRQVEALRDRLAAVRRAGRGHGALLVGDGQGGADRAESSPRRWATSRSSRTATSARATRAPRATGWRGRSTTSAGRRRRSGRRTWPRAGRRVVRGDAGPGLGPARHARRAAPTARPWWSSVTAASWCTRCCAGSDIEPMGGRTRAWLDPVNSSLTEWRMAEHPYVAVRIELVRFNDHGHLRGDLLPRSRRRCCRE